MSVKHTLRGASASRCENDGCFVSAFDPWKGGIFPNFFALIDDLLKSFTTPEITTANRHVPFRFWKF